MNRNIFTFTVGMLALMATMLILGAGTGGASSTLTPSNTTLRAQSGSQSQQPDVPLVPVTSTFTYQGYLAESGSPATGQYDFEFRLFDAASGGSSIGPIVFRANETVNNGVFTVPLDFGSLNGNAGWLEIKVRRVGGPSFVLLTPRQRLTPAPYALTLSPGAVISGTLNGGRQKSETLLVINNSVSNNTYAIRGVSSGMGGEAVVGQATGEQGSGIYGLSSGEAGIGVKGMGLFGGLGVYAGSTGGAGTGIVASASGAGSKAGIFFGDVGIIGNLSKGGGSFKIDHPLDPANKYLYHSFVESPDMMNIYNGNVVLNAKGEATVQLPDWFGALNKEYRYQLTAIGAPGPNLYVSREVESNRFSIAGGTAGMKVSWQVTGIRKDAYADANRIPVEEDKKGNENGKYLYPEVYGQPETMGIEFEQIQQLREDSEEAKP